MGIRKALKGIKDEFIANTRRDLDLPAKKAPVHPEGPISPPSIEKKEVHIHGGQINRVSFKAGDIFINYNNSLKNNQIKETQILTGHVKYSSFTGGGIIISDTHLMQVDDTKSAGHLTVSLISDKFSSSGEYCIFRPVESSLAEEMVDLALDLYWNSYIPTANMVQFKLSHLAEFLSYARTSKSNRAFLRFSNKAKTTKNLTDIRNEYQNMIKQTSDLQEKVDRRRQEFYQEFDKSSGGKTDPWKNQVYVDKNMRQYLTTLTPTGVSHKSFFPTQFITWVVQAATGVLHEQYPEIFTDKISDVLDIRDTKATPARLTELLKKSKYFIEYECQESRTNPLNTPLPIMNVAATEAEVAAVKARKMAVLQAAKEAARLAEEEAIVREAAIEAFKRDLARVDAILQSTHKEISKIEFDIMEEANKKVPIPNRVINSISKHTKDMPLKTPTGDVLNYADSKTDLFKKGSERDKRLIKAYQEQENAIAARDYVTRLIKEETPNAINARITAIIAKNEAEEAIKRFPLISGNKLIYEALTPKKRRPIDENMLAHLKQPIPSPPSTLKSFDERYDAFKTVQKREEQRDNAKKGLKNLTNKIFKRSDKPPIK